jgi:hypothetical protein
MNLDVIGSTPMGALFNDGDRRIYRYALWRIWDRSKGVLLFLGLNPSTANEKHNDPTITRLVLFAKGSGYGGLYAGNLVPFISAFPEEMLRHHGLGSLALNDEAIKKMSEKSERILVGWGEWGRKTGSRPKEVLALLDKPVYCLRVNESGEPRHPLYLPGDCQMIEYRRQA